jgi:hypothetical protein
MGGDWGKRLALITAIIGISSAAGAAGAGAATVTVGSPMAAAFSPTPYAVTSTAANTALPEPGAKVTSPIDGTIVRWRVAGASGGPFRLRVLTPVGGDVYVGAGTSAPASPASLGVETFAANLPIEAGQTIGLDNSNPSDTLGVAEVLDARFVSIEPQLAEGVKGMATFSQGESELAISADVQPPPTVDSISPASGPTTGGTEVTISGRDFNDATAVRFGSTGAASFSVGSSGSIVAVTPPGRAGTVDVVVSTIAGTSAPAPAGRFTYADRAVNCVVPKLRGRRLRAAKRRLRKARCRLGKVRGPKRGSARVRAQRPKPGAVRPAGTRVRVKTFID